MGCKKGHKKPKKLPYGATKGRFWCWRCDADLVPEWYGPRPKAIKKRERQKARRDIRQELIQNSE